MRYLKQLNQSKKMAYMFDIRPVFSRVGNCDLVCAAVKASSWNGLGCALIVRPLQVLVRVVGTCAMACPVARWHVKLRQAGATPWASGVIAYNARMLLSVANNQKLNHI